MNALKSCGLVAMLLAAAVSTAAAQSDNTSAAAIRAQQDQIRAELADRQGRFKHLDPEKKATVLEHQSTVLSRLEGVERTTELREIDQLAIFNALESIEAILNKAEDDRMICERYKPTGSNRPTTLCKTVAQRRAEKQVADDNMSRDRQCVDAWSGGFCKN